MNFAEFLAAQLRDKGISLKRLSETTGIAPAHLEALLRGDVEGMPPTPYFRGYLARIGKVLGFDGEEWWKRIKKEDAVRRSGPHDSLPENRFLRKAVPKWIWITGVAAVLLIIYLSITLPRILGRPSLTVTFPSGSPYIATSTTVTLQGVVHNTDALFLGSGDASSSEPITIAPDGTWSKTVLLQTGLNTFEFRAKKFLGGETSVTEQILYEAPGASSSANTISSTAPSSTGAFLQ